MSEAPSTAPLPSGSHGYTDSDGIEASSPAACQSGLRCLAPFLVFFFNDQMNKPTRRGCLQTRAGRRRVKPTLIVKLKAAKRR